MKLSSIFSLVFSNVGSGDENFKVFYLNMHFVFHINIILSFGEAYATRLLSRAWTLMANAIAQGWCWFVQISVTLNQPYGTSSSH